MINKCKNKLLTTWTARFISTIISTMTVSTEARSESASWIGSEYGLRSANTVGMTVALCALIVLALGSLLYMVRHYRDVDPGSLEHDELTGLYSWDSGMVLTRAALRNSHYSSLTLVLLDVDNTGDLREACGDAAIDAMLAAGAQTLNELLRERDVVCRVMNDTFMVCLVEHSAHVPHHRKVESLRHAFDLEMVDTDGIVHEVHASAGAAFMPTHGKRLSELYDKADLALYWAKRDGKNRTMVYRDSETG